MAKLKNDPITDKDLADFVANDSDFAFEMRVVAQLRQLKFDCSHSGTYQDPVSHKIRQFDIRAVTNRDSGTLALAVECKNLRPNHPLLLSALPRTETEAFHDLVVLHVGGSIGVVRIDPVLGSRSVYKPGEMVGRKTDQVGRDSDGKLVSDDILTFEKINQAVNSCKDLVQQFVLSRTPPHIKAVVPVLVVPASLLWQVDYTPDGTMQTAPRRVPRATLFLNNTWTVEDHAWGAKSYRLSHIEIVTLGALTDIVSIWLGPSGFFPTP
jgi:hypothetical protein